MTETSEITGWHAHVYFDAETAARAGAVCDAAAARFDLVKGRVHERCVGPHPMWSCQLACSPAVFAELLPWLTLNRDGLIVFAHPETGDDLTDHRDRGVWLGAGLALDLSVLS